MKTSRPFAPLFLKLCAAAGLLASAAACNDEGDASPTEALANGSSAASNAVMSSDALLDMSGINTKFFFGETTVYGANPKGTFTNTDAVLAHVLDWGGRVVREHVALSGGSKSRQRRVFPQLAAAGIRWHVTLGDLKDVAGLGDNSTAVRKFARDRIAAELEEIVEYGPLAPGGRLANLVHSLAGPNEVDNRGDNGAFWAENARIFQEEIWNQAHAIPALAGIPIAAPSTRLDLTLALAEQLAGPNNVLQTFCDLGNPHLYQRGRSPSFMLDDMLETIRPISGNKPAIFSETGYQTSGYAADGSYVGGGQTTRGLGVPEWAASTYAARAIGEFGQRRAVHVRFELLDDPDPSRVELEAHLGIVRMTKTTLAEAVPSTWQPKPELYTMRRLHNLLRDPGPAFATRNLGYTVVDPGPTGTNLRRLLVQKRDGRHLLLLWRDVDVFRPNASGPGTVLDVPEVPVSIRLESAKTVNVYQPNDATLTESGSTSPVARVRRTVDVAKGGTITVRLDGDLKVLEIL